MRVFLVGAGAALGASALRGTRPVARATVGRDVYPGPERVIVPDDVTVVHEGARFFLDGVLTGLWRSMRGQTIRNEESQNDLVVASFAPLSDGSFVEPSQSAAGWAERESQKGRFVLGPIYLAYDVPEKRIVVSAPTMELAKTKLAVLLAPNAISEIRKLANDPDSGG